MPKYYRFLSGDRGIYAAVDVDCPRGDPRRKNKPDGSWLPKVGPDYPGAISFWTEKGLQKYMQSGLMEWHISVVKQPVKKLVLKQKPRQVLYEDEYQIIVTPSHVHI